jgi:hypothetical protein
VPTEIYISPCVHISFKIHVSLLQTTRPASEEHQRSSGGGGAPHSLGTAGALQSAVPRRAAPWIVRVDTGYASCSCRNWKPLCTVSCIYRTSMCFPRIKGFSKCCLNGDNAPFVLNVAVVVKIKSFPVSDCWVLFRAAKCVLDRYCVLIATYCFHHVTYVCLLIWSSDPPCAVFQFPYTECRFILCVFPAGFVSS